LNVATCPLARGTSRTRTPTKPERTLELPCEGFDLTANPFDPSGVVRDLRTVSFFSERHKSSFVSDAGLHIEQRPSVAAQKPGATRQIQYMQLMPWLSHETRDQLQAARIFDVHALTQATNTPQLPVPNQRQLF
jgi:hypothetical protein